MSIFVTQPTPYPDINVVLRELLTTIQTLLGDHLIGMYLEGSLANGDFDAASDIDFVVVTQEEISDDQFLSLQAMHDRIATGDSPWVIQIEGSYLSAQALQRYDPALSLHPNIERGVGERLKWVQHGASWVTHRYILRQHGITLVGPPPQTLIDPISPDDLRQGMRPLLQGWATQLLADPTPLTSPGSQAYIVLSMCRILYTLRFGAVVSKRVAAEWARATLGERWAPLIDQVWQTRLNWQENGVSDEKVKTALAFIQYTIECGEPLPKVD